MYVDGGKSTENVKLWDSVLWSGQTSDPKCMRVPAVDARGKKGEEKGGKGLQEGSVLGTKAESYQ